jgi:DNA replication protein DnaC
MSEELEQLLKNLRLRRVLEIYDEQLRAAEKEDVTYTEFVTRLVRAQWHSKQEGALEWRIRRANLPERLSLETFPFARQPGVNRKQIRAFAELEFIANTENIVLVGPTGVGKTGLCCGLLLKALENGYRCQFVRAQDLFDEMYASLADRSTRQLLKRLARLDVLLIDEFGYLNLKPEQSNIFFKTDGGTLPPLPPAFHPDYNELGLRGMAQLPRQPADGGSAAEPASALLPYGTHSRSFVARSTRLRTMAWARTRLSLLKNMCDGCSPLTVRLRELPASPDARTGCLPLHCMNAALH